MQTDPNTAFLRAARAGQLDKLKEYLDSGTVRDINTSNAVRFIFKDLILKLSKYHIKFFVIKKCKLFKNCLEYI